MKAIGGYFGLEEYSGEHYHSDMIKLNSGRNALLYVLEARRINKIYLPRYLCDSVSKMCELNGYDYQLYSVDQELMPIITLPIEEGAYVYIVNYYGLRSDNDIKRLENIYGRVIMDYSQCFFRKPLPGVDTIYSCRKFFGLPDGAYLSTDILLDRQLEVDVSDHRMKHILGRYEGEAEDYYLDFKRNDSRLAHIPLRSMSRLTDNLLKPINYKKVIQCREENYEVLEKALGKYNTLKIISPIGPFVYPFYHKDAERLRKELLDQKVYIPILWPNVKNDSTENSIEWQYANHILPLPVDQRYTPSDMMVIVEEMIKCIG